MTSSAASGVTRADGEGWYSAARRQIRLVWHTRPGHSPGLIRTRRAIYCAACGADLSSNRIRKGASK